MKLNEIWSSRSKPTISFELFPARNEKAVGKLEKVIDKLAALEPDLVSVTFGAGGSNRKGSYELAQKLKQEKRLEVLAYFAGFGLGPDEITSVLDDYRDLGIDNLLVIRGDEPEAEGYSAHPESLAHASDMLSFIRPRYDFFIGAAGYPEGHKEAESREKDLEYLKLKVEQGAQFIIAQYFYNNSFFFDFLDRCKAVGIEVPIIPGVMPVYTVKMTENLARICGATITDDLRQGLDGLPEGDKKAVTSFGIDLAYRQSKELLERGVPGLHFYTMDKAKTVVEIVTRLRKDGLL